LLVDHPDFLKQVRTEVLATDFEHPVHQRMYTALLGFPPDSLAKATPEELGQATDEVKTWSVVLELSLAGEDRERVFADGVLELTRTRSREPTQSIRQQILEAERVGDHALVERLMAEAATALRLKDEGGDRSGTATTS
jgi:hypothetical protein